MNAIQFLNQTKKMWLLDGLLWLSPEYGILGLWAYEFTIFVYWHVNFLIKMKNWTIWWVLRSCSIRNFNHKKIDTRIYRVDCQYELWNRGNTIKFRAQCLLLIQKELREAIGQLSVLPTEQRRKRTVIKLISALARIYPLHMAH